MDLHSSSGHEKVHGGVSPHIKWVPGLCGFSVWSLILEGKCVRLFVTVWPIQGEPDSPKYI